MDTAFDPNTTSPEGQEKKAAAESVRECLAFVLRRDAPRGAIVGALVVEMVNGVVAFVLKVVALQSTHFLHSELHGQLAELPVVIPTRLESTNTYPHRISLTNISL